MRASVVHSPARASRRASRSRAGLARGVEHDGEVRHDAQRLPGAAHPLLRGPDLGEDRRAASSSGVTNTTSAERAASS